MLRRRCDASLGGRSAQVYQSVCGGREWVHALVSIPAAAVSGYLTFHLLSLAFNGFYFDLNFYYKLTLFRAATQAEPFLRFRGPLVLPSKSPTPPTPRHAPVRTHRPEPRTPAALRWGGPICVCV